MGGTGNSCLWVKLGFNQSLEDWRVLVSRMVGAGEGLICLVSGRAESDCSLWLSCGFVWSMKVGNVQIRGTSVW